MGGVHRLVLVLSGFLALSLAQGCSTMSPMQRELMDAPPFVRAEHICPAPGQKDVDIAAVKKDLGSLLRHVRNGMAIFYYGPLHEGQGSARDGAQELIQVPAVYGAYGLIAGTIRVTDSRVVVSDRMYFDFAELVESSIKLSRYNSSNGLEWNGTVEINDLVNIVFHDSEQARCVADTFNFIRAAESRKLVNDDVAAFQPQAEQYRALADKPPVTEEQRKYVVQADAMAQGKDYAKALDLYAKALAISAVSYPAAHYNMALIAAELGRYHTAIASMRKYLLLVSDPGEARSAQDKIYEWQAKAGE